MAVMDIIIGGFLLYGFIRGVLKGLFTELAALLSLLLGLYAAIKFSGYVGGTLSRNLHWNETTIKITAFIITFAAAVLLVIFLGKFFTKLAKFAMMGWLNKLLGGIFGLLKWAVIISILLHIFVRVNFNYSIADKKSLDESIFFYPMLKVSSTIYPTLTEWFSDFKEGTDINLDEYNPDEDTPENSRKEQDTLPEEENNNFIEGLNRSI